MLAFSLADAPSLKSRLLRQDVRSDDVTTDVLYAEDKIERVPQARKMLDIF